jgi:phage N-6-adenine-methyltransferase
MTPRPEHWTSDEWETPPDLVKWAEEKFGGPFTLDVAATAENTKAPNFYTKEMNGLSLPWTGRVWMNPPYSNIRPWLEKAIASREQCEVIVCLLPCATDTKWFHDCILPHFETFFIKGRVRFLGWDRTPIPAPKSPNFFAVLR